MHGHSTTIFNALKVEPNDIDFHLSINDIWVDLTAMQLGWLSHNNNLDEKICLADIRIVNVDSSRDIDNSIAIYDKVEKLFNNYLVTTC
jgi:hypothetical protein